MPCFCRYMPIRRFQSHSDLYQLPAFPIRPSRRFRGNINLYACQSKTVRNTVSERIATVPGTDEAGMYWE